MRNKSSTILKLNLDVRIQIASDLHVEFYGTPKQIPSDLIVPNAPVLALLGDIGVAFTDTLRDFLHQQADQFEYVLFLPGNHEFYHSPPNLRSNNIRTVQEQMDWMKQICGEKDNLIFMEQTAIEIQGVLILGTTLWSWIPERIVAKAKQHVTDYGMSPVTTRTDAGHGMDEDKIQTSTPTTKTTKMTPAFTNQWFRSSVAWLEEELGRAYKLSRAQPVVILTHHTPSPKGTSHPRYDDSDLTCCFSTDLSRLLRFEMIQVWACGHTHYNFDFRWKRSLLRVDDNRTKCTVRLVSNQRGYPGQENMDYDNKGIVIKISPARQPHQYARKVSLLKRISKVIKGGRSG